MQRQLRQRVSSQASFAGFVHKVLLCRALVSRALVSRALVSRVCGGEFSKQINKSGPREILRSLPGPSLFVRVCWLPDAAPPRRPGQQQLRHSAPASNKPHLAAKSTPVWLAIWRTWAGFANSQHRYAAFATPKNICAHSSLLPHWAAAQTDANLSAHLHRLPTPPPYLRPMRLLHGRVRRCWVPDEAVPSQGRRYWVANDDAAWPGAAFLQITARTNPCSRHLWGTLARAVASI